MNGYVFVNVFPSRNIFLSIHIKNSAKSFLYKVFSVKISLYENKIHHACKIKCVVVSVSNCHKNEKKKSRTGDKSTKTHIPPFRNKSSKLGELLLNFLYFWNKKTQMFFILRNFGFLTALTTDWP